jgi:hypothetical protein
MKNILYNKFCAVAQMVSRWSLTAEAQVRTRVNSCGVLVSKLAQGQFFLRDFLFSITPPGLHTRISGGG